MNLENIPAHWQVKTLGEVAQVLDNLRKPINSSERNSRINGKQQHELFPYYGATGQVGWIDDYLMDGEYVLIGEDGAPFFDHFRDKAYLVTGKTWVNNHAHILLGKNNGVSNGYLMHYLNVFNYQGYVNGTTRLKLTKGSLVEIPIPIPPDKKEQQAIVAKLEGLFASLEAATERLRTAQQQLAIYRQVVLKHAFEGRLTHPQTPEGQLPEGWKWVKLGEVIEKPKYGTSKKCEYETKGKVVLRIPNISDGFIDHSDFKYAEFDSEEIEKYQLIEGDILTIRSNGSIDLVGKCALISKQEQDYLYAGYLIRLRPIQSLAIPKYLLRVLISNEMRIQIETLARSTSGVNNINSEEIRGLSIPLPPVPDQHRIVAEIEHRLGRAAEMEAAIAAALEQAKALRQSILKAAFEGRLLG